MTIHKQPAAAEGLREQVVRLLENAIYGFGSTEIIQKEADAILALLTSEKLALLERVEKAIQAAYDEACDHCERKGLTSSGAFYMSEELEPALSKLREEITYGKTG